MDKFQISKHARQVNERFIIMENLRYFCWLLSRPRYEYTNQKNVWLVGTRGMAQCLDFKEHTEAHTVYLYLSDHVPKLSYRPWQFVLW